MSGKPMATSVAAALYSSQNLTGVYKNKFITFSESPQVWEAEGNSLAEKIWSIKKAPWGNNTDIEKVFQLILTAYKQSGDMVDRIVIVSDMEFDEATDNQMIFYDNLKSQFAAVGCKMPELVFWNVNANKFHVSETENSVALISGSATGIFETVLTGELLTPIKFMLNTLQTWAANYPELITEFTLQSLTKF